MKKTTFYTLLCTTIILPGALLAAEQLPGTPIGKAAKLQQAELVNGAPKTPQLREQQEVLYSSKTLTPDTKVLYVELGTAQARRERDEEKQRKLDQVLFDASQQRLKRDLELEEKKRLEEQAEQEALVLKAREAARQKQEANEALEKQISQLTDEVATLQLRLSNSAEVKKLSADRIREMSDELRTKSDALAVAQEKLREAQNQTKLLEKKAARAEDGEKRLAEGLNAIIAEKEAGNAGGGGAQAAVLGGGQPPVPDAVQVQQVIPGNVAQPGAEVKVKKALPKANLAGDGDGTQ